MGVKKLLKVYGGCLDISCRWRTWQTAISFGEVSSNPWSGDFPMEQSRLWQHSWSCACAAWQPGELKHLSNRRKRKKCPPPLSISDCEKWRGTHSQSSGERNGNSPNRALHGNPKSEFRNPKTVSVIRILWIWIYFEIRASIFEFPRRARGCGSTIRKRKR